MTRLSLQELPTLTPGLSAMAYVSPKTSPSSLSPLSRFRVAGEAVGKAATVIKAFKSPNSDIGPPIHADLHKCGVGLFFVQKGADHHITITEITPLGSAEREGSLRAGDMIVAVDEEDLSGKLLHEVRIIL